MFSQFRARYPTGSLIAELLTIHQGKYVVRALVQVEDVTLATGLAAADTAEQAEDRARIRALEVLGIALSVSPQELRYGESLQTPASEVQPSVSLQTSFVSQRGLSSDTASQIPPSSAIRELPVAIAHPDVLVPPPSSVEGAPQSAASDDWLLSDDESASWKGGSKFSAVEEQNTPNAPANQSDRPEVVDFSQPLPFEEPSWNPAFDEPMDLSDALAKIDELISRLGWTPEIERDFLKRTYGKGKIGRSFLDSSEVMEFLDYLEAFAKTSEELNRLGWTAKIERIYLKNAYGREERSLLTYTELLQFLQYLEVFGQTSDEIRRLGWNQQQGIDYLLQTYGKKGRSELSYEQLLAFRNYLQSL